MKMAPKRKAMQEIEITTEIKEIITSAHLSTSLIIQTIGMLTNIAILLC